MSKNSSNRKALNLLEKLVQEQGETTPEQQRLLDTLIMKNGGDKFYKKENGKYISKSAAGTNKQRSSRARTKVKKEKSNIQKRSELIVSQSEQQNHETHKISVPDAKENPSSRSSSRSSASSFWSHGQESKPKTRSRSKSRSRSRSRSDSRSRSYSDSRSRSRSRSSSGSRSSSRSRSRSGSRSGSSRSRSESRSRSGSSRSRSRSTEPSHSTVQSVPVKSNELHVRLNDRDTMSDIGIRKPPAGSRRRKLAKRGQIRKFRSLEINPDIFFEERLQQKYKELADIMKGSHLKTSTITRQHLGQMQKLREQYHMVSHGLAPPGVLVPRSLPSSVRNRNNSSGIGKKKRPMSGSSYNSEFSSFAADPAYGTLQDIMNGNSAQERHLLKPIRKTKKISKKKDKKHKGSNSTLDDVSFDLNKIGGSDSNAASTPRSVTKAEREDHHIKVSENPKLLQWLKEKDKMHRKKKREEKMKKREERDKMVLEANERFEKRLEAQKIYDKWLCEKNVEISKQKKYERKERKRIRSEREMNQKNEMTVRSKSASLNRRDKSGGVRVEGNSETNFNIKKEKDAVESQNGNASDHVTPHPPASKFIYKRPVAGRIKLRLSNSATGNRPERPKSANSSDQKNQENKTRMSYDQWILQKRKQDELKKDMEEKRRQEQLSKSDPDMNKLIPEIAKKRIHNVLEGKKRIDTGVQRIDEKLNKKFGGKDFNNDEGENSARESEEEKVRYSYRLESDEATKSSDKSSGKLNVSGKAIQRPPGSNRPQTAPAGGNRVPPPKHSSGSPRKAVVPAKVEEVMSNEDTSNPFKLPFPEDQGVPKHVASRQRKLFADRVWSNLEGEERPEPQGSDIPEPPLCVSSSAPQKDTNDSLDESGVSESNDINDEDAEESKEQGGRDEESKVFLTQFTSVDNLANISKSEENEKEDLEINGKKTESENVQTETNTKEAEKTEENHINSVGDEGELKLDTDESDIGQKETQQKMNKDNGNDDLETDGLGEKSEEKATENIKETLSADDDNLRPESANTSRSKKSVSFCEDPEVFGLEQEEQEWSTDTQTPEEDNAMYMSSGDRYSRDPDDTDMIRTNDSLDDDF